MIDPTQPRRPLRHRFRGLAVAATTAVLVPVIGQGGPATASAPTPTADISARSAGPDGPIDPVGPADPEGPGPVAPDAGPSATITLITGDVVVVERATNGTYTAEISRPAVRPDGAHQPATIVREGTSLFVYPEQALALVTDGLLDRRLFDVTYLVENGYADDVSATIPIIAQYPGPSKGRSAATTLRSRADALPASTDVVALTSVDGAALHIEKAEASTFWEAITAERVGRTPGSQTLGSGLAQLWLDGTVQADLDTSVGMIGAPQAWEAGYDGTGVTVAVLDSGIDATHPDLTDQVAAAESFIAGQQVADGNGHGTHVASTIAGTGVASDGRFTGVAPGARLLIGKILGDSGQGPESAIIAGMQWAVDGGADIVSMSVGGCCTDGTDPMSQAVDALSAESGALFVIAAGNNGAGGPGTINSPGAAASALTVAAVDDQDQLAPFSSRGPRIGDYGLKPDIAAPGVDITAARAAGTELGPIVDERYQTISGTSMATPHVAGAAAILAQEHPDWTGQQLKNALMSTAKDDGFSAYEQGAGRVDVPHAIEQGITATGSIDFGAIPFDSDGPVSRTVTYTNHTADPVTLRLTPQLTARRGTTPPDALILDRSSVEVAAGGTADVAATFDPSSGPSTWYEGAILATADGLDIRTAVGGYRALEQVEFTGRIVAPDGATDLWYGGWVFLKTDDQDEVAAIGESEDGAETSGVLNAGHYAVRSFVRWRDSEGRPNSALVSAPEVDVTADTTFTFDLRRAKLMHTEVPKDVDSYVQHFGFVSTAEGGRASIKSEIRHYGANRLWALPTGPEPELGNFYAFNQRVYTQSRISLRIDRGLRPLDARYSVPNAVVSDDDIARLEGRKALTLVDAGHGTEQDFQQIDADGKLVLLDLSDICALECTGYAKDRVARAAAAGAAGVIGYGSVGQGFLDPDPYDAKAIWPVYPIPTLSIPADQGSSLVELAARRTVRLHVDAAASPGYVYTLAYPWLGSIPDDVSDELDFDELYRVDSRLHGDAPGNVTLNWSPQLPLHETEPLRRLGQSNGITVRAPATVTTYYGPLQPDVGWSHGGSMSYDPPEGDDGTANRGGWSDSRFDEFVSSGQRVEDLGTHPIVPNTTVYTPVTKKYFVPSCLSCRNGNMFNPVHVLSADGRGGGTQAYDIGADINAPGQTELHLFRDGTEVPAQEGLVWIAPPFFVWRNAYFTLPPERADYRLTERWRTKYTMQRYAREVNTSWTFSSEKPTTGYTSPSDGANCMGWYISLANEICRPTAELFLGYDLGLRIDNTLPAGRSTTITLSAFHSPFVDDAPGIRSIELWMSTDPDADGGWQRVPTRSIGGGKFRATLQQPGDGVDAVSLRVRAVDAAGNTVTQTIDSAYGVR